MKRPLDDGYAATPNIQVEAINQAIAQHQNVIQMQSDAAQVLGTVSGLVAALGGGYPAEQLQAVASQLETLRAIQTASTQALHASCATLQNRSPQQMQPQMFAPQQQQMQQQQMQQQQLYVDIDPFGPGAMASPPLPFADPRAIREKRKTSLCNNFGSGLRTGMVEWSQCR